MAEFPKLRYITKHSKDCSHPDYHEMYVRGIERLSRDVTGRVNHRTSNRFLVLHCNNADCGAEAIVQAWALAKALEGDRG